MTKTIYFDGGLGKVVKAFSFIFALALELFNLVIWPIKLIGFRAHLFVAFLAAGFGAYLHFFTNVQNAAVVAVTAFAVFAVAVALIKLIRRGVARAEKFFLNIYDCPVGVYMTYRPLFG